MTFYETVKNRGPGSIWITSFRVPCPHTDL